MNDERKCFWERNDTIEEFKTKPLSTYITKCIDKLIISNITGSVLDIGCGGGRYSIYLKQKGINVFAIDRHEKISEPIKEFQIPFIKAEMDQLPFNNNFFQIILSIGVLHNATSNMEFKRAVCEISRVLKPNGFCICSIFTNDVISKDLSEQKENGLFLISDKLPVLLLSKKEINETFNKNNLFCIKVLDQHITTVKNGNRHVYSFLCQKK